LVIADCGSKTFGLRRDRFANPKSAIQNPQFSAPRRPLPSNAATGLPIGSR
jgi:hypothetical protein